MLRHLLQPRECGFGETPHGVAVKIDRRTVVEEAIAKRREWILCVEHGTRVSVETVWKMRAHRRFLTSHSSGKNRCAMVLSRYATPPPPVPGREPISRAAMSE